MPKYAIFPGIILGLEQGVKAILAAAGFSGLPSPEFAVVSGQVLGVQFLVAKLLV
jgi:hypothetical protein